VSAGHTNSRLSALIEATGQSWRIEDILSVTGGEVDMGCGEKLVGYVVQLRDNRRFELRTWRRPDGTLATPTALRLPGRM
jgi:hypothetical protein